MAVSSFTYSTAHWPTFQKCVQSIGVRLPPSLQQIHKPLYTIFRTTRHNSAVSEFMRWTGARVCTWVRVDVVGGPQSSCQQCGRY